MSSAESEPAFYGDNSVGRLRLGMGEHQVRHRVFGNPGRLTWVRIVCVPSVSRLNADCRSIKESRIGKQKMADTTTYFGNAVLATYPDGSPIIVNGRPLLIPETYSLQQQIDAAHFRRSIGPLSVREWFLQHFPPGGSGDPQRQAGWSGGSDARFTDAGNYGYGLSAAAADLSLDHALSMADLVNRTSAGKPLPAVNERAIRQGYNGLYCQAISSHRS